MPQEKPKRIIQKVVYQCLGYREGERILLITDDSLKDLAEYFYHGIKTLGVEVILLRIIPRRIHGEEPPPEVAAALRTTDIALLITEKSLSHTRARQKACRKYGVRIASLPGITIDILNRSIDIDYKTMQAQAKKLARKLSCANEVRIKTKLGTDLTMSIKGRKALEDNGLYVKNGAFGNLPAGEVCIAPVEGTTEGTLIVDASFSSIGKLDKPIKVEIKDGYARKINDARLKRTLSGLGKSALNIAEFGLGLNPKARVSGNILEDEKALNTAHIALGDNLSFAGRVKAKCHLDGVFLNPIVYLDNKKLTVS